MMSNRASSRRIRPSDPDFSIQVRRMLADDNSEDDGDFSGLDDSDADPDFIISDDEARNEDQVEVSSSTSEDEDNADLLDEGNNTDIINAVAEGVDLPEYFLERLGKKEIGPSNAWKSKPPPRNVRIPARNLELCHCQCVSVKTNQGI